MASVVPKKEIDRRGGTAGHKGIVPHQPTRALRRKVETLAALGLSQEAIAFACDVGVDTIKRHYRTELTHGLTNANARVGAAILSTALGERDQCEECSGTGGTDDAICDKCKGTGEAKTWRREPNTTAQIWWSKNRMQWTDRERIEHVGDGGGPVVHEQRNVGDTIRARLTAIQQRTANSNSGADEAAE